VISHRIWVNPVMTCRAEVKAVLPQPRLRIFLALKSLPRPTGGLNCRFFCPISDATVKFHYSGSTTQPQTQPQMVGLSPTKQKWFWGGRSLACATPVKSSPTRKTKQPTTRQGRRERSMRYKATQAESFTTPRPAMPMPLIEEDCVTPHALHARILSLEERLLQSNQAFEKMQDELRETKKNSQASARKQKQRMKEMMNAKSNVKKRLQFDPKPRKLSLLLSKTTLSKTDSKFF
jgi:hypothetical protein